MRQVLLATVLILCALASAAGQAAGVVGLPYHITYGYAGDGIFFFYTFQGGTLPPGLSWIAGGFGEVKGIPTTAGSYSFNVSVDPGILSQGISLPPTVLQTETIPIRQPCAMLSKAADVLPLNGGSGQLTISASQGCNWA